MNRTAIRSKRSRYYRQWQRLLYDRMHRTRSIDYAIIMEGEIDMLLDDSDVHLKAGDVVIQRGTYHAWANRSGKPCKVFFILIDADPL